MGPEDKKEERTEVPDFLEKDCSVDGTSLEVRRRHRVSGRRCPCRTPDFSEPEFLHRQTDRKGSALDRLDVHDEGPRVTGQVSNPELVGPRPDTESEPTP